MIKEDSLKAFYFPHDIGACNDPKLIDLRMRFGWKAIGMYWAIIEALHKETNGEMPDFMISSLIIDFYNQEESRTMSHSKSEYVEFEECLYANALLIKCDSIVTAKRVKKNLLERQQKSEKARVSAGVRWHKDTETNRVNANAMPAQCERNAIKERKGKERKENKRKVKEIIMQDEASRELSNGEITVKTLCINIINDLNMVLGSDYKITSKTTQDLIKVRLSEGFILDDFKTVHRKMAKAWGLDNKMRQFLRPITLYSGKFESYLNRPDDIKQLTPQQQDNLKQLAQLTEEVKNDNGCFQSGIPNFK